MANVRKDLEKAFELINKDRLDEALSILRPITQADPDNADAWWLTANAASEPRDARQALVNLLKLNPKYPKARQLLDQLNEMYPPRDDELLMMMDIEDSEPDLPSGPLEAVSFDLDDDDEEMVGGYKSSNIDDLFTMSDEDEDDDAGLFETPSAKTRGAVAKDPFTIDEDDFETAEDDDPFASILDEDAPQERASGGRRRLLLIVGVLLVVCLVAALLFALLRGGGDDTADSDTEAAAADPGELVSVDVATIPDLSVDELESVRLITEQDARARLDPAATAVYVQLDSGLALMVRVCATPGPDVVNVVRNGFEVVAPRGGIPSLADELTMVGVSVHDCTNEDVLYRAMATAADASAYSNRATDFATFQQTWQNVES